VNDAQFSPNGNQIVTVSNDKTARVWDVAEAPLLAIKEISQNRKIELSANLNYYQSAGRIRVGAAVAGNVVWVWDEAGKMVAALRHGSHVVFWKLSPDGKGMVTICEDATVKVWNLADEKATSETLRHEGQPPPALDRDHRPVGGAEWKWGTGWQSAEFSPDASRLVTVSEATAQVWDVAGGKAESPRQVEPMSIARFSADGTRIVIVGSGRTAQVWDAATGKPVGDALLHEEKVNFAQFNPDGTRIVTACDDGTVTVWDAATGKPVGEALRHAGRVRKAEFSPDGRQIVTVRNDGNGQTLSVWDVASGKTIGQEFKQGQLLRDSVWFSPDGTRLVTILEGGDGKQSVQVWEVASGKVLLHIPTARTAVFSPDGKRLVTAVEKTIQVWDVTSGKPLGDALDDDDWVSNLNFSSDGTRIVTGASLINHTRRVWWVPWLKDLPSPAPEWFRQRAAAIAGFEFDANGETHVLPAAQRIATLLAPVQGNDAWSLLARWLAQPAGERTLNPDSPLTRRQTAERERDKGMSIELQYGPRPIDYAQAAYARLEIFPQLEAFRAALHTALREDSTAPLTRLLLCEFEGTKKRAAFLRDYDLKRLPDDAGLWARASLALTRQRQPKAAIDAARKALSLDGESPLAWRAEAGALSAKGDREESLASYERLLAMGRGGLVDYDSAVFLAVELGNGDRARKIIAMAEQQFPSVAFVSSMEGRALMDLHAPQEAIAAFERYQALLKPPEKIDNGMIARLAISRWLTGDKDGAVREYEKLLALKNEPWWGDSEKLSKTAFPPVEMTPLKELIAETLKRRAEMPPPQK